MFTTWLAKYAGRLTSLFLWGAGVAVAVAPLGAADVESESAGEDSAPYKHDLSPDNLQQILNTVRPHGNEWRHLHVEWLTDVVAARKRAAAEDKPIIICYTGGAGYNEPLGVC